MEQHSKLDFKTIILTLVITFTLTGCTKIFSVLDIVGVIPLISYAASAAHVFNIF